MYKNTQITLLTMLIGLFISNSSFSQTYTWQQALSDPRAIVTLSVKGKEFKLRGESVGKYFTWLDSKINGFQPRPEIGCSYARAVGYTPSEIALFLFEKKLNAAGIAIMLTMINCSPKEISEVAVSGLNEKLYIAIDYTKVSSKLCTNIFRETKNGPALVRYTAESVIASGYSLGRYAKENGVIVIKRIDQTLSEFGIPIPPVVTQTAERVLTCIEEMALGKKWPWDC